MTVYKRKNSSSYQYEFKYKGERYRGTTHCTSKRDAEEYERKIRREISNQVLFGKIPEMTLEEAIERYWTTHILPTAKPKAARSYFNAYRLLRSDLGPDTPITHLTYERLNDYKDDLLSGKMRGRKLKPGTINRQLNNLRAILNKALNDWGTLVKTPRVPKMKVDDKKERWLTSEEEKRLIEASPPHIQHFIIFCLETGARKSEAIDLKWSHVDLERKDRGVVSFMNTKSNKPRGVPLSKKAQLLLEKLFKDRDEGLEHVFTLDGKPAGEPKSSFNKAVKRAGLYEKGMNNVTPHVLRHTFCSRLVMKSVPLYQISKLAGHSSIKVTERYAHLAPEALDDAIAALD